MGTALFFVVAKPEDDPAYYCTRVRSISNFATKTQKKHKKVVKKTQKCYY